MAATILSNKKGGEAVCHMTATSTIVVAGGSSDIDNDNDIGINDSDETVTAAVINQVTWGTGGADNKWTIARGSNTAMVLNGSGHIDLAGSGYALDVDSAANVVCTLGGTTPTGFLIVELQKRSTFTGDQYLVG